MVKDKPPPLRDERGVAQAPIGRGWLLPDAQKGRLSDGAWRLVAGSSVVMVLLLGVLDHLTGTQMSFLLFYLVPIALVAWFGGVWFGFAISAFAALVWFLSHSQGWAFPHGTFFPFWNSIVGLGVFMVVAYVVSMQAALRRLLQREKELSGTDHLTGVMNRRVFGERVTEEILRSERYVRPFSLAYMDLDNFKALNDQCGHSAGDRLLRTVATTLRSNLRSSDVLARLGGDEFGVLLPETGAVSAASVLRKAQEKLSEVLGKGECEVTLSIGLLTCERPPESYDQILKMADALMYAAKKEGKNRVRHEVLS
ncbi:MAG: GGDEF domain-containing protein [Verrucomicrobiota bacterium]